MLTINVPDVSLWDEANERFLNIRAQKIEMEHSLVSISKWESTWEVPFLTNDKKTIEQLIDYLKCMTLTKKVNPSVYEYIIRDPKLVREITDYIEKPMTATKFKEDPSRPRKRSRLTSEHIYYLMIALNIPSEYQKWHINRLLTLIQLCDRKNTPPKKRRRATSELLRSRYYENEARKKAWGTRG